MYGTVNYFSDCLTANMMNRLVNEHVSPLNKYVQLLIEEIRSLEAADELKVQYTNNLEVAYKRLLNEISAV